MKINLKRYAIYVSSLGGGVYDTPDHQGEYYKAEEVGRVLRRLIKRLNRTRQKLAGERRKNLRLLAGEKTGVGVVMWYEMPLGDLEFGGKGIRCEVFHLFDGWGWLCPTTGDESREYFDTREQALADAEAYIEGLCRDILTGIVSGRRRIKKMEVVR